MTQKTFNLVNACLQGGSVIVVAIVTYCVKDAGIAASVNAGIILAVNAAAEICKKFVKES